LYVLKYLSSQEKSESFSLIGNSEASNPHRRVTKVVPNLSIILIG
jgi:hypothetical protein